MSETLPLAQRACLRTIADQPGPLSAADAFGRFAMSRHSIGRLLHNGCLSKEMIDDRSHYRLTEKGIATLRAAPAERRSAGDLCGAVTAPSTQSMIREISEELDLDKPGTPRSLRLAVRNPVLALPEAAAVKALPLDVRVALAGLLDGIRRSSREKAASAWARRKFQTAAYWAAVGVYARHIRNTILRQR